MEPLEIAHTHITLPSTVQGIGFGAFNECMSLKVINLWEGIQIIDRAFQELPSLMQISILHLQLKFVARHLKLHCIGRVYLCNGLQSLQHIFSSYASLMSIIIPFTVAAIGTLIIALH